MIESANDSVYTSKGVQVVSPQHIHDNDPIGDGFARATQQRVQPVAVKQQFVVLQYTNNPDLDTAEPLWVVKGMPDDSTLLVTWQSYSPVGKQLFGFPTTSLYAKPTAASTFEDFSADTLWPFYDPTGGSISPFDMKLFPVSTWVDQASSNGNDIVTRVAIYNGTGAPAWVCSTMRMRLLLNTDNSSITR